MNNFRKVVEEICKKDARYKPDAYEFVLEGLHFTQEILKKQPLYKAKLATGQAHVSGRELSQGLRDYAINQYGALAGRVLSYWGINQTEDFGNIVFNMVERKLFSKTEDDSLADFKDVYDFKTVFSDVLTYNVIKEGLGGKE
jgi:uncharacterized repeat protein (TIGR04138 family)